MRAHFMLWERFIGPILKAMRILVIRHLQGYGNTVSLRYPDTWARKPDCLHLPYTNLATHPERVYPIFYIEKYYVMSCYVFDR